MAQQIPIHTSSGGKNPANVFRRVLIIPVLVFVMYLVFKSYTWAATPKKPQVIYADRYSHEYKFRPAASPIITEKLKDGSIRIRGHDTRDL